MTVSSVTELVQELLQGTLLSAARQQELTDVQAFFTEPGALAQELTRRGWLTLYQLNQVLQGCGRELVLGPYMLLERLGEGGMGQVFKAHHTFLNRLVALELISKTNLDSGPAAERFLREMQLAAQLDHLHLVRAFDAGQIGDRYYLAMELIEGVTLSNLVQQRGPLAPAQACVCIQQAALGLQHAHERGLVHRDIKPSNLMLATTPGGPPVLKILDLGLARPQREPSRDLTRTGMMLGSMDYLAPEQALDPRAVDGRADLYSLGCTFFFLLTGQPPFHGGTDAQKLLQHQQQEAPAIVALRAEVGAVLRRMLAKRPEERFATAAEVAVALQPFASWQDGLAEDVSLIEKRAAVEERGWTLFVEADSAQSVGKAASFSSGAEEKLAAFPTSPTVGILIGVATLVLLVSGGLGLPWLLTSSSEQQDSSPPGRFIAARNDESTQQGQAPPLVTPPQSVAAPKPSASEQAPPLPQPVSVGDLQVTTLPLPAGAVAPGMCWADDGKHVYLAGKDNGSLQMLAVVDGRMVRSLELHHRCSYLSRSAEGLLLTLPAVEEITVVDPRALTLKKTIAVPAVQRAVSAPGLALAFAEVASSKLVIVDVKTGEQTPLAPGLFHTPLVSPDGAYLFSRTGGGELLRSRFSRRGLVKEETSARLSNGRASDICVSADGKYICLPTGGGNPSAKPYSTHIFLTTDLRQPVCVLEQGACPQYVAFDVPAALIYAQNAEHHLMVFDFKGRKLREYDLGRDAGAVCGYLVYPEGRKVLIVTDRQMFWVQLPATFK